MHLMLRHLRQTALMLSLSAAARLNAARINNLPAMPVAVLDTAAGSTGGTLAVESGFQEAKATSVESDVMRSEDYDAKLALKMQEIEVLQRRTEENISRLTSSRHGTANTLLAMATATDQQQRHLSEVHQDLLARPAECPTILEHSSFVNDSNSGMETVEDEHALVNCEHVDAGYDKTILQDIVDAGYGNIAR